MVEIDTKIEIKFLDDRLVKLQKAHLQMIRDYEALGNQIKSVEKEIVDNRGKLVRLKAIEEETALGTKN